MLLERLPIHIGNLRALPARLEPKDRELCVQSGTLTCEKMREYTVTVDEIHALGMNLQQVCRHARAWVSLHFLACLTFVCVSCLCFPMSVGVLLLGDAAGRGQPRLRRPQ